MYVYCVLFIDSAKLFLATVKTTSTFCVCWKFRICFAYRYLFPFKTLPSWIHHVLNICSSFSFCFIYFHVFFRSFLFVLACLTPHLIWCFDELWLGSLNMLIWLFIFSCCALREASAVLLDINCILILVCFACIIHEQEKKMTSDGLLLRSIIKLCLHVQ